MRHIPFIFVVLFALMSAAFAKTQQDNALLQNVQEIVDSHPFDEVVTPMVEEEITTEDALLEDVLATPQMHPIEEEVTPIKQVTTLRTDTSAEKVIFLTFDDGPLRGTQNILNVLQQEQVNATMFMVGKHIKANKKLYEKVLDCSHVCVANHTYSHADGKYRKFYSDGLHLLKDVKKNDMMLSKERRSVSTACIPLRLAGRNVFRLPALSSNDPYIQRTQRNDEAPKYDTLYQDGFYIYGWDAEWSYDPSNGKPIESPEKIVDNLERIYRKKCAKCGNKVILLMHDFMFRDRFNGEENLHVLIRLLKEKGWKFATIEQYI